MTYCPLYLYDHSTYVRPRDILLTVLLLEPMRRKLGDYRMLTETEAWRAVDWLDTGCYDIVVVTPETVSAVLKVPPGTTLPGKLKDTADYSADLLLIN